MNLFTANQVNQVYVANKLVALSSGDDPNTELANVGDTAVKATADGCAMYFVQRGKGGIVRSDLIPLKNILWARCTPASYMALKLKKAVVTLSDTVNGGDLVEGQDYILRVAFDNYIGISPEDSSYWKYGVAHVYTGMTKPKFYATLALSLVRNMMREAVPLIDVYLTVSGSSDVPVTKSTKLSDLAGSYDGIKIVEADPSEGWIRGLKQIKPLKFTVQPTEIEFYEGNFISSAQWGTVEYGDSGTTIGNGMLMADYEYFYHGERGDQYRLKGWPDYVPTEYMVDPSKTYDTVAIHFAYVGPNESVQKSEKDITLLVPTDAASGSKSASWVSAIDTIAGAGTVKTVGTDIGASQT